MTTAVPSRMRPLDVIGAPRVYITPSSRDNRVHYATFQTAQGWVCTCPGATFNGRCKHIDEAAQRETAAASPAPSLPDTQRWPETASRCSHCDVLNDDLVSGWCAKCRTPLLDAPREVSRAFAYGALRFTKAPRDVYGRPGVGLVVTYNGVSLGKVEEQSDRWWWAMPPTADGEYLSPYEPRSSSGRYLDRYSAAAHLLEHARAIGKVPTPAEAVSA